MQDFVHQQSGRPTVLSSRFTQVAVFPCRCKPAVLIGLTTPHRKALMPKPMGPRCPTRPSKTVSPTLLLLLWLFYSQSCSYSYPTPQTLNPKPQTRLLRRPTLDTETSHRMRLWLRAKTYGIVALCLGSQTFPWGFGGLGF